MSPLAYPSPVYQPAAARRLKPSVAIGLLIALGLHLLLAAYLITQTIAIVAPPQVLDTDHDITDTTFVTLPRPAAPKPVLDLHRPAAPLPSTTETLTAPPNETPAQTVTQPAELPRTPADTSAAQASGTSETGVAAPRWARFPGPEALSEYYPPRALEAEAEGTASVECVIKDAQGRVACRVLSEQPGGYGFGEATRRMIEKVGRIDVAQSGAAVGSTIRLSVRWTLPQ